MRRSVAGFSVLAVSVVTVLAGAGQVSAAGAKTHHAPKPSVSTLSATSGPSTGGVKVTVKGKNFTHVKAVEFGSVRGSRLHVSSSHTLTVVEPAHPIGRVDVRVVSSSGTSKASSHDRFDYQQYASVAAGYYYSCAVANSAGRVSCWGSNGYGELGDASDTSGDTPVTVHGLSHVVAITASSNEADGSTCALKSDGTVWCWGDGEYGEMGTGTSAAETNEEPVHVSTLSHIVALTTGDWGSCAVRDDGTAWCWGYNYFGVLGNGSTEDESYVPVRVSGLTHVTGISQGGIGDEDFACAVAGGKVYCWGDGEYGELGNGTTTGTDSNTVPVRVKDLTHATAVTAGGYQACAIQSGRDYCWGYGDEGQLGNGGFDERNAPVAVEGLNGVTDISAGASFSCAIAVGSAYCWGEREYAEIGDGGSETSSVDAPTPTALDLTGTVYAIAGDGYTGLVRTSHGLRAWGYGGYGGIGNGSYSDTTTPVAPS